ncbi:MAG: peptidase and chymotrypsin/Hap [Mycobacterium sp.]|nr:peptidase and chymotrypsin/Hap [Mycobacterium sp.]
MSEQNQGPGPDAWLAPGGAAAPPRRGRWRRTGGAPSGTAPIDPAASTDRTEPAPPLPTPAAGPDPWTAPSAPPVGPEAWAPRPGAEPWLPGGYGADGAWQQQFAPQAAYAPPREQGVWQPRPQGGGTGPGGPTPGTPPPAGGSGRRILALVAVVAVIAALLGGVVGGLITRGSSRGPVAALPVNLGRGGGTDTPVDRSSTSVQSIAAKLLPSVVTINVSNATEEGTGSGIILTTDGYILTNNHVVAPSQTGGELTVTFNASKDPVPATIVGQPDPTTDLAVIKVQGTTTLTPAVLGHSSSLVVGDPVVAIGAPLGLSSTVTLGIVSALGRPVDVPTQNGQGSNVLDAIQTDAAINPGNSGGALVDSLGQVVGVNSAIASLSGSGTGSSAQGGSIGIGFAIPIDEASSIAEQIIRTGHATHPYIGVNAQTVSSQTAQAQGLPRGALVASVVSGGPADKAGIRRGDVITKVDATTIDSSDSLVVALRTYKIGDKVSITYVRSGQPRTATVTLVERQQ